MPVEQSNSRKRRVFKFDVFLSHNAKDKPRVRQLAERLKKSGLRVWFDEWNIKAGDMIAWKVDQGLEQSRVLVLCVSSNALASGWVTLERYSIIHRDPVNDDRGFIPLLLSNCRMPATLSRYKYVDFREDDDAAFKEILNLCLAARKHRRKVAKSDKPSAPQQRLIKDDPQKGKWGGLSEANHKRFVVRKIIPWKKDGDWFKVPLEVHSIDRRRHPLVGKVTFHLHNSFDPNRVKVKAKRGVASLILWATGAFTVGAECADGTKLEVNLAAANIKAPKKFKKR